MKNYPLGKFLFCSFFLFLTISFIADEGDACTIFGVQKDEQTIVAKNRDRRTRYTQVLVYKKEAGAKYQTLGVASLYMGITGMITSGVNEKGLVVVSSSLKSAFGIKGYVFKKTTEWFLKNCANVNEVIQALPKAAGPFSFVVADENQMALIEIGKGRGIYYYKLVKKNKVAYRTNRPRFSKIKEFTTKRTYLSSPARHKRIKELLNEQLTVEKAIEICRDHANFGYSSICRHETPKTKSSTISSTVYLLEKGKKPKIWVALNQPCTTSYVEITFGDPIPRFLSKRTGFTYLEWIRNAYWRKYSKEIPLTKVQYFSEKLTNEYIALEKLPKNSNEYRQKQKLLEQIDRLLKKKKLKEAMLRLK